MFSLSLLQLQITLFFLKILESSFVIYQSQLANKSGTDLILKQLSRVMEAQ